MAGIAQFLREVVASLVGNILSQPDAVRGELAELSPSLLEAFPELKREAPVLEPMRIVVGTAGQAIIVSKSSAILLGVILRAGASEAILRVYNQGNISPIEATSERPGVRTSTWDGWVNRPTPCSQGIVVTLDKTDAIAWVWFEPLVK